MEDTSRFVCHILDQIGYGWDEIKLRQNFWRKLISMLNQMLLHNNLELSMIAAGSKAEGLTSMNESDLDLLYIDNDVICSDSEDLIYQLPDMITFQTDMANAPPGYTKLKLASFNASDRIKYYIREINGQMFASSALFTSSLMNHTSLVLRPRLFTFHELSGPSSPISLDGRMCDIVCAFPCIHPDILQSFRTRLRQHDWPPVHIIQDNSPAVCQLVPVGHKGSSDQMIEWRFCFIPTEMSLTHSLNHTQLKVYIVLKMIAKDILKCVTNEISSYIMKNIIYWMSEQLGCHWFREDNFIALILMALNLLKISVENNYLPYFMIPARNLLAERLESHTRGNLSDLISKLLEEGPLLLLRCTKLQKGMTVMYRSPEELVANRNNNELFERLHYLIHGLSLHMCSGMICGAAETDMLRDIINLLFPDIPFPDWRELAALGIRSGPIVLHRVIHFIFPDQGETPELGISPNDLREALDGTAVQNQCQRLLPIVCPDWRELVAAHGIDSIPVILQRFMN